MGAHLVTAETIDGETVRVAVEIRSGDRAGMDALERPDTIATRIWWRARLAAAGVDVVRIVAVDRIEAVGRA